MSLRYPHTPLEVRLILHCYCLAEPIENPHAPAVVEAVNTMLGLGLIAPVHLVGNVIRDGFRADQPHLYMTTHFGRKWVKRILAVPAFGS